MLRGNGDQTLFGVAVVLFGLGAVELGALLKRRALLPKSRDKLNVERPQHGLRPRVRGFMQSLFKLATSSPGWVIFSVFYALAYVGALWETLAAIDHYFRWRIIDEPRLIWVLLRDMGYSDRYTLGVLLLFAMTIGLIGAVRVFEGRIRNGTFDK